MSAAAEACFDPMLEQANPHSEAMPQVQSGGEVVDLTLEADGDAEAGEPAAAAAAAAAEPGGAGAGGEGDAAADCGDDASEALVECSTATHGIRLHKRAP